EHLEARGQVGDCARVGAIRPCAGAGSQQQGGCGGQQQRFHGVPLACVPTDRGRGIIDAARRRAPVPSAIPRDAQPGARSEGWLMPSLVGTSPRSKGLMPSRQATLSPYSLGSERRWWWVWMPHMPQNQWRAVMVLNWYRRRCSRPAATRRRCSGTVATIVPLRRHSEQSQRRGSTTPSGSSTSSRTAPQWQLARCTGWIGTPPMTLYMATPAGQVAATLAPRQWQAAGFLHGAQHEAGVHVGHPGVVEQAVEQE